MREFRVECRCLQYTLGDLGISLKQGDVVFIPEEVGKKSQELDFACRVGALSVNLQERCRVERRPDQGPLPPFLRAGVRRHGNLLSNQPKAAPTKAAPSKPSPDVLEQASAVVEEARKATNEAAKAAVQEATQGMIAEVRKAAEEAVKASISAYRDAIAREIKDALDPSKEGGLTKEALEQILLDVLAKSGAGVGAPVPESHPEPDEPVFIPDGLATGPVPKNLSTTTVGESESSGIRAAAEALKALRNMKKD